MNIDGIEFAMVQPARRGGSANQAKFGEDDVVLSIDKSGAKGVAAYALRISIHKSLAKKARLIEGDVIQFGFNQQKGVGIIRRVNGDGYKLSGCSKKSGRLYIKPNWRKSEMPSMVQPVGCPSEIKDEGIVFMLPDCVSFDRNLRAEADAKK
jgi:hypothetical protein